jgi:hypothetical protein
MQGKKALENLSEWLKDLEAQGENLEQDENSNTVVHLVGHSNGTFCARYIIEHGHEFHIQVCHAVMVAAPIGGVASRGLAYSAIYSLAGGMVAPCSAYFYDPASSGDREAFNDDLRKDRINNWSFSKATGSILFIAFPFDLILVPAESSLGCQSDEHGTLIHAKDSSLWEKLGLDKKVASKRVFKYISRKQSHDAMLGKEGKNVIGCFLDTAPCDAMVDDGKACDDKAGERNRNDSLVSTTSTASTAHSSDIDKCASAERLISQSRDVGYPITEYDGCALQGGERFSEIRQREKEEDETRMRRAGTI